MAARFTKSEIRRLVLGWVLMVCLTINVGAALIFFVSFASPTNPGLFEAVVLFPITIGWVFGVAGLLFVVGVKLDVLPW
jgi:hypothetical protein